MYQAGQRAESSLTRYWSHFDSLIYDGLNFVLLCNCVLRSLLVVILSKVVHRCCALSLAYIQTHTYIRRSMIMYGEFVFWVIWENFSFRFAWKKEKYVSMRVHECKKLFHQYQLGVRTLPNVDPELSRIAQFTVFEIIKLHTGRRIYNSPIPKCVRHKLFRNH